MVRFGFGGRFGQGSALLAPIKVAVGVVCKNLVTPAGHAHVSLCLKPNHHPYKSMHANLIVHYNSTIQYVPQNHIGCYIISLCSSSVNRQRYCNSPLNTIAVLAVTSVQLRLGYILSYGFFFFASEILTRIYVVIPGKEPSVRLAGARRAGESLCDTEIHASRLHDMCSTALKNKPCDWNTL